MKFPFSPHFASNRSRERTAERERRYPIYTAFDLAIYWLICGGLFLLCATLAGLILMQNSPQFASRAMWFAGRLWG